MANKKDERQSKIYHILLDEGRVSVKLLANRLKVTPETIRSDLSDMEDQRRVIREHGFARPLSTLERFRFKCVNKRILRIKEERL